MDSQEIKRVPYPEHPDRCQGTTANGQCMFFAVEGGDRCIMHGGNKQLQSQEIKSKSNYDLTIWQARVERMKANPDIKSLRDEIAIARMLLEERFKVIKTNTDLILQTGAISDLVSKIERLVLSCHKLEASMGQHLDKSALMQFAGELCSIIGEEIDDPEAIKTVSTRVFDAIVPLNAKAE